MSLSVGDNQNLRVVLDSNVLLSALVYGGNPRKTMEWLLKNASIIYCTQIITEIRRIVSTKFPDFTTELLMLEKLLERDAIRVEIGAITVSVSRDPDDNAIIESALAGQCHYIISGDKDLLVLGSYSGIKIVKPADFLGLLGP